MSRPRTVLLAVLVALPLGVAGAAALPSEPAHALRSKRSFRIHEELRGFESESETFRIQATDWKSATFEVIEGDDDTRVTIERPDDTTYHLRKGRRVIELRPEAGKYKVLLSNLGFGSEDVTLRVTLRR